MGPFPGLPPQSISVLFSRRLPGEFVREVSAALPSPRFSVVDLERSQIFSSDPERALNLIGIFDLCELGEAEGQMIRRTLRSLHELGGAVFVRVPRLTDSAVTECLHLGAEHVFDPSEPPALLAHRIIRCQEKRDHSVALERLSSAIEAAPFAISVVDLTLPDQPLVFVNRGFERLTGFPRAEVLGRNCRLLQGGLPPQSEVEGIRDAIESGQPYEARVRNVRRDGSTFLNQVSLAPIPRPNGRPGQYIGLQLEVPDTAPAPVTSPALPTILSEIPAKVCLLDPHLRLEFASPACGVDAGQGAETLFAAADRESALSQLRRALTGTTAVEFDACLEGTGWHHCVFAPRGGKGAPAGLIGVLQDISAERAKSEASTERVRHLGLQNLLMRRLLGDPELAQTLGIVAELADADQVQLASLQQGELRVLSEVVAPGIESLTSRVDGERLSALFPFSHASIVGRDSAMAVRSTEAKHLQAGVENLIVLPICDRGGMVGLLLVTSVIEDEQWCDRCLTALSGLGPVFRQLLPVPPHLPAE